MPMLEVKRKYDGSVLYPESDHDDMNLNANLQVNESDVSNTNPVYTRGAKVSHTFHNAVTAAADGTVLSGTFKSLTIFITGTSTSKTLLFKGRDASGNEYAIVGVKVGDPTYATTSIATTTVIASATPEAWIFNDIEGFTDIMIDLSVIGNGNVTVKGEAILA